jgi:hypothetical protein
MENMEESAAAAVAAVSSVSKAAAASQLQRTRSARCLTTTATTEAAKPSDQTRQPHALRHRLQRSRTESVLTDVKSGVIASDMPAHGFRMKKKSPEKNLDLEKINVSPEPADTRGRSDSGAQTLEDSPTHKVAGNPMLGLRLFLGAQVGQFDVVWSILSHPLFFVCHTRVSRMTYRSPRRRAGSVRCAAKEAQLFEEACVFFC